MSEIRLDNGKILCAEKLFQFRHQLDKSVPQKGGAKEYAPDGSWMLSKRLEAFHQERTAVLGEQRVERLGSVVQATWNQDRGLVDFKQEVGKFWSHMGFVDQNRKWLYPEEALFLMETCVLEVYHSDIPLSIQEAYAHFLSDDLSLDEYQAYAHLRRLGFVVLRHLGGSGITPYERKIKLDQHIKDSKRRRRHHCDGKHSDEEFSDSGDRSKKLKLEERTDMVKEAAESVMESSPVDESKSESRNTSSTKSLLFPPWNIITNTDRKAVSRHCVWDFDTICFPDIGNKDTVILKLPESRYIPPNVVINEEFEDLCLFDVGDYRQHHSEFQSSRHRRHEKESHVFDLDFSYSEWARSRRKISAKNWTEYKEKLQYSQLPHEVRPSPAGHLWEGEVTPLVRPQDATSTSDVMSRLQVVKSMDLSQCGDRKSDDWKISFDVYLPNAKFKKTKPGLPNHRVCVVRSTQSPPTMADIIQVVSRYSDNVPVNWAVVDSGDIAFYSMSDISLPVDITQG